GGVFGKGWNAPRRLAAGRIVVRKDLTAHFVHRPGTRASRRNLRAVRNCRAGAVAGDTPAVKRALDRVTHHLAPMTEMRADVRAMRVEKVRFSVLRAEEDKVASEIV